MKNHIANIKNMVLILIAAALSGCAGADMIVRRGDVPNAPVNETKGGVVKLAMENAAGSRKLAYKRMRDYCEGDYRITAEESGSEETARMIIPTMFGGVVSDGSRDFRLINFECVKSDPEQIAGKP